MKFLSQYKILSLGTVRLNRLPNNKQPNTKQQSKMKKEISIKHIPLHRTSPFSVVTWKDNKAVSLLLTYCGELPKSKMVRFYNKIKIKPLPYIVQVYNRHMGGVDSLDSLIERYKIKFRS